MRFIHGLLVSAIIAVNGASVYLAWSRGLDIIDLIRYGGEVVKEIGDTINHTIWHQEATPLMTPGALLSLTESTALLGSDAYNGFYLDTLETILPKRGIFGWDWIRNDGRHGLWAYLSGTVPVAVDLSTVGEEDIVVERKADRLSVTITLPMPTLQTCRLDYDEARFAVVEAEHLNNRERADMTFDSFHQVHRDAIAHLEAEAVASGIIQESMENISAQLVGCITAVYPGVEVQVRFEAEEPPYPDASIIMLSGR